MEAQFTPGPVEFDAEHPIPLAAITAPIAERLQIDDFHCYGGDGGPYTHVEWRGYDTEQEEHTYITLSVASSGDTLDLDFDAEGSIPGSVPAFESTEHATLWLGDFMAKYRPLPS